MRLIDADALIPNISVKAVFGNDVTTMKCGELRTILEMIENAPTIEPQKKRGKWDEHHDYPGIAYLCNQCKYFSTIQTNFCPNCGADMRGDKK